MTEKILTQQASLQLGQNHLSRYQRWRLSKDYFAGKLVVIGGLGVIAAIVMIFFYLLYVVAPLFESATITPVSSYQVPSIASGQTLLLAMEEQNEIAVRFTDQATAIFFSTSTGQVIATEKINIPAGVKIVSFAEGQPAKGVVAYGLSNGSVVVAQHRYKISYPHNQRLITPVIEYPLGSEPLIIDQAGRPLDKITLRMAEDETTLVAQTSDNVLLLSHYIREESLFGDAELEQQHVKINLSSMDADFLRLDKEQRLLYLAEKKGDMSVYDLADKTNPVLLQHLNLLDQGDTITYFSFLNAELSLLVADNTGLVRQWSLTRDQHNQRVMSNLRTFKVSDVAVLGVNAEQRRKGFATIDGQGQLGIYHSTAERELIKQGITQHQPIALVLSPRANALLLQTDDKKISFWRVKNEHPDVSVKSLWQKVWYESYPAPDYIWQSSSSSNDFEPKMSLTPLLFGTLKAAFYAMLVAIPLAIMGAIYTAYFMAPRMRSYVKPSIELMEALPTVILGFLAGLWLAPVVEAHLLGVFSILMLIPVGVMLFAFGWQQLPKSLRHKIPEGWDAALLIPVVLLSAWLAFLISPTLESIFFAGDLKIWMNHTLGIGYDQRNSLVVGLAMGFAVIPTIFSITEDAIFSVPKNLTVGSLALGATPWQTMTRVVLLTASPGIFSAVMIGFGRAVGETMIVLMATGNTPVMDLSIFQGMRTLSANIAVEMPEAEVNSTHYRVLFLAALVLFMFTFIFNTLAELVRQNLREKYSSL